MKSFLKIFMCAIPMLAVVVSAFAQGYPEKPVRYLIPDAPGSGSDTVGRILAEGLTEVFGQQVVVDNRPGAGTTIGLAIGAKAPTDGYTLVQNASGMAAAPSLYRNLPFDPLRDFATVSLFAKAPQVAVVHPAFPVKSLAELVKQAKAKPGAINYASAGTGSSTFFAMELFKEQAGIDIVHVPYRGGGAAVRAVVSGEVSVYMAPLATALPHIQANRLRALAATTLQRLPSLPDLPTVAESGFNGYEAGNWYGMLVPTGTSPATISVVNRAVREALKKADARLTKLAYISVGSSPSEYSAYLRSKIASVAKTYKRLGLKPGQ